MFSWLFRNVLHPITTNLYTIILLGIGLAVFALVAHVAKGFLCPDLAVNQLQNPWYCHHPD